MRWAVKTSQAGRYSMTTPCATTKQPLQECSTHALHKTSTYTTRSWPLFGVQRIPTCTVFGTSYTAVAAVAAVAVATFSIYVQYIRRTTATKTVAQQQQTKKAHAYQDRMSCSYPGIIVSCNGKKTNMFLCTSLWPLLSNNLSPDVFRFFLFQEKEGKYS